jgi:hypothetical protein
MPRPSERARLAAAQLDHVSVRLSHSEGRRTPGNRRDLQVMCVFVEPTREVITSRRHFRSVPAKAVAAICPQNSQILGQTLFPRFVATQLHRVPGENLKVAVPRLSMAPPKSLAVLPNRALSWTVSGPESL